MTHEFHGRINIERDSLSNTPLGGHQDASGIYHVIVRLSEPDRPYLGHTGLLQAISFRLLLEFIERVLAAGNR